MVSGRVLKIMKHQGQSLGFFFYLVPEAYCRVENTGPSQSPLFFALVSSALQFSHWQLQSCSHRRKPASTNDRVKRFPTSIQVFRLGCRKLCRRSSLSILALDASTSWAIFRRLSRVLASHLLAVFSKSYCMLRQFSELFDIQAQYFGNFDNHIPRN